jgi:eukaryotic-like serine/threonine-protein kinase
MPPMTGRVIAGRYNLQHPIGRGAMGVVWRARDQLLDRDVAVKEVVISALIGADERRNAYQRTLREARTAARLSHRGVVAVYDVAEEDGRPWIVMELVPSQSLDQVLVVDGRLPPARAGRIGQQLLSALAAAHAAGVLHRDVKPSNVLIATSRTGEGWDERAVLTDFGIAQFEGDPRLTQTGMVMGSPGFTAPERIRGSDASPASDLWSLGATIYAAVEGRGPYEQRGGAITTMSAIINEDAPVAPHAGQLAPVIAALLRRDPTTRPSASAAARMFAQALPRLAEVSEEPPPQAHPPTIRSSYLPSPAAPVASSPVTAPDDARVEEPPAPAASADPAVDVAEEPAEEAAAEAEAVEAATPAAAADSAEDAAEAEAAEADAEPESSGSDSELASASEPAAETAEFKVAEAAEIPVPEAAPAEAAVAESKAAGTLLDERSRAAETVIPGKGSAEYQPTELSIPAARATPSAPVQPPAGPKSAEAAQPPKPGPTFTAAKPTDRAKPSFSAASPASPARPARPVTPPPEQRPAYGPSGAGPGYPPPKQGGSTTPFPPSSAQYTPVAGQYAGPSQAYPDAVRQYTPGTRGGRAGRGQGPNRRILWLVIAVIIAAAVGVGAALALNGNGNQGTTNAGNTSKAGPTSVPSVADTPTGFKSIDALNSPSTALPNGWSTQTVTAADANSVAGFSIDVPPGWKETRKGPATDFNGPGNLLVEVDLTQQQTTNMLTAAKQVQAATHFSDYKQLNLQAEPVRHAEGAVWKFTWTPTGGAQYTVDDIFFAQPTSAGVQDYAVYIRSPSSTFGSTSLALFDEILPTFQTVPAS